MASFGSVSSDAVRVRRCTVTIPGVVQGIGFRPFVYRMALSHGLGGSVRNCPQGPLVDLEGHEAALKRFLDQLQALGPPAGSHGQYLVTWEEPHGVSTFAIGGSARPGTATLQ